MFGRLPAIVLAALAASATARAQVSPERAVVDALRANPQIAPYPVRVDTGKSGEILLSGKVGSRGVHDLVIHTVLDMGLVPHDDLVIDTGEAYRVAAERVQAFGPVVAGTVGNTPYYLAYPPYAARPSAYAPRPATAPAERLRRLAAPALGNVRIDVDEYGRVHLSGEAASEEARRRIEEEAIQVPGVTGLDSDLTVSARPTPPPPPPMLGAAGQPRPAADPLAERARLALARNPALKGLDVAATSRGDEVAIRGKVPSAYEAMLAFRAVQRTPGIRDVVDEMEFPPPDEKGVNPLRSKAGADDLEPYLLHHIRRRVGDAAHVDRTRVMGGVVQVRGTLAPGTSPERIQAILDALPLLRGFHVLSSFTPE